MLVAFIHGLGSITSTTNSGRYRVACILPINKRAYNLFKAPLKNIPMTKCDGTNLYYYLLLRAFSNHIMYFENI